MEMHALLHRRELVRRTCQAPIHTLIMHPMLLSRSDELSTYKGKEALSVLMLISAQSAMSAWDRRMVVSTSVLPLSLRVNIYM